MFHTFVEAERNISIWIVISSAIRQNGKSHQNECYKKTKHANFSEKETFVSSLRGKNCSLFRKLDMLCFLVIPVLRFTLLPYYRRFHCVKSVQIRSFFQSVFSRIHTEYWEILCISPYSVRMRGNTNQKNLCIRTVFRQCLFNLCLLENSELCRMNNLIE